MEAVSKWVCKIKEKIKRDFCCDDDDSFFPSFWSCVVVDSSGGVWLYSAFTVQSVVYTSATNKPLKMLKAG